MPICKSCGKVANAMPCQCRDCADKAAAESAAKDAEIARLKSRLDSYENHAHWVGDGPKKHCSACGMHFVTSFSRCPRCGAFMDGSEASEHDESHQ